MTGSPPPPQVKEELGIREASVFHGSVWLFSGLLFALIVGIAIPIITGHVPWSWEKVMARALPRVATGLKCRGSPDSLAALNHLIKRIYPIYADDSDFPVHVIAIHAKEINAFAYLGGQIYINEGLISQAGSPEELAAVLAHEMEHVKRRHVLRGLMSSVIIDYGWRIAFSGGQLPGLIKAAAKMSYSRDQEAQADRGALERLRDAHVSLKGFEEFFRKHAREGASLPSFLSDHPSDQSRLKLIEAFKVRDAKPVISAKEWAVLKTICH